MTKKNFVIVLVLVFTIAGTVFFSKSRIATKDKSRLNEMPKELEQKILSFELVNYTNDGRKKWMLKGDSADILAEVVNLSNINMETYEEPKIILTALLGAYDKKNKEISLFENVKVLTSDNATLTTDYLKWNGDTDTITTDEPVRMVKSDVVADGIGALAMPQMKKLVLDKDIIVKLNTNVIDDVDATLEEKKSNGAKTKVIITCNGPLVIDYEKNTAVFEDNVVVDYKQGKIYSEKMEAFLDPVTKNITRVVAKGDVKVVRGEDSTYSQKAIYTTKDQKIILIGKPRIHIHSTDDVKKIEKEFEGI